jgi:hypothetical protein
MSFLVRLATKSAWPGGEPHRDRAVSDFALREGERGLSLWEYTNETEFNLALAAMACERIERTGKFDKLDYLVVSRDRVERFGVVTQTPGETPLPRANEALHRELQWDSDELQRLAEALFDEQQQVTRMAKSDVRKLLMDLSAGEVSSAKVQNALSSEKERALEKK